MEKNFLLDYAQIKSAKAKNLMAIENIEFENILCFSAKASSENGKTTVFNMLKSLAGAKFTEKPLKQGKESGFFAGEIKTAENNIYYVEYFFEKENNIPILKTFLKNGEKTTKKDFAEMIKEVEPKVNFDINTALSLTGRSQADYFIKSFGIDIKKEEIEFKQNYEIRTDLNKQKEIADNRYLRLNMPNYDVSKVEKLKNQITKLDFEKEQIKTKISELEKNRLLKSKEIENKLNIEVQKLESQLSNLQTERQNYNTEIENKEANLRAVESAKTEIEKQTEIIKKYIPKFSIELKNFDTEILKQGLKVPVSKSEIDNYTNDLFIKLPEIMQTNLLNRSELLKKYYELKEKQKADFLNSEIETIDNQLKELSLEFLNNSGLNEKLSLELSEIEKNKTEYQNYLSDLSQKKEFEKCLEEWQKQDIKVQNSLQKIIDKLNNFKFSDENLKFNGFINDRGHLDIILKYNDLDFSAMSEGKKAMVSAYLQASLIKKGELGLVFIPAKYMSKNQVDEVVSYLVSKGLQPYLEFTLFENNKKISIDHYLDFQENPIEKDF